MTTTVPTSTEPEIAALLADTRSDLDAIPDGPWEVWDIDSDRGDEDEISVRAGTAITSPGRYLARDMIAEWDVYSVYDHDEPDGGAEYQQRLAIARFVAAAPAREARFIEIVEQLLADNARLQHDLHRQAVADQNQEPLS